MAGGGYGDPGIEIEKPVPIDIFDHGAFPARGHQRITTGVGRRQNLAVAADEIGGAWARQGRQNMREVQTDHFFSRHCSFLLQRLWVDGNGQQERKTSRSRTDWGGMLLVAT